jgi:uncharacterized protein
MECPICKVTLLMAEKQGIEIDYCPTCRGVWLDRGELEKIIEKTYMQEKQSEQPYVENNQPYDKPFYSGHHDSDHHGSHGNNKYGRKKSFLSELFD